MRSNASLVIRSAAGLLAIGFALGLWRQAQQDGLRPALLMDGFICLAFLLYAIGGQSLLQRILPVFRAKSPQQPAATPDAAIVEPWAGENQMVQLDAPVSDAVETTGEAFQKSLAHATPRLLITPLLVVINVLVFVAMVASGISPIEPKAEAVAAWGGNFGPKTMNGQWWRLVTCMFLHFGILHLAVNMWVLWDIGRLMERLVGNLGFSLLYLFSGILASLASLAWNSAVVGAGASGAVFGVAGGLLGFLAFRSDTVPRVVLTSLRNSMFCFLFYNVIYGMARPEIDMAAHLGGLAAGFGCGLILSQPISIETYARRRRRNLAVTAAAIVLIPSLIAALPEAPPDVRAELEQFAAIEKQLVGEHNGLVDRAQAGELTDEEFADRIEADLLAPWTAVRQRLEAIAESPGIDRAKFSRLLTYVDLRQESWQLLADGCRKPSSTKLKQHREKWDAANKLAKELGGTNR